MSGTTPSRLPSRHNILGQLPGSATWFLVNPLSRSADLLSAEEAAALVAGRPLDPEACVARGYLVDPAEEEQRFRQAYLDFLEEREQDEVQLFFVPWYACNFGCAYCYQAEYEVGSAWPTPALLDAFFAYVDREFAGRRKYLTLFGGEPLLAGAQARAVIEGFVARAAARGLELAVVTNGYLLAEYLPLLRQVRIRELQVTLDGVAVVHDPRRPLHGGGPTFDRIAAGLEAALTAGLPVNLRVVVDRDNLEQLSVLAAHAAARGWTAAPSFKTQLGRNYELHHCHHSPQHLYSRLELHQALFELYRRHPELSDFHRPAFSLSRFLFDEGELPPPLFDDCSGCKTEWAFDHTGRIYSCTATVGRAGEELGTFWPAVSRNEDAIAEWQDRDVLAIPACRDCTVRLACGGGCAAVARHASGRLLGPDCFPIRELLELGLALYLPQGR